MDLGGVDASNVTARGLDSRLNGGTDMLYAVTIEPLNATFFLDPDGFRIEIAASRDARL